MPDNYKQVFAKDLKRLKFSLNAACIGVWEVDIATNTVIWDDRCRELFGLSKDNILPYEKAIRFIHPEDAGRVNEAVQAALRGNGGGVYDVTYRTIGADDGLLRWVNFSGTAYFDDGQLSWFGGVAREVTEQVTAHNKVEESVKRFRNLADRVPQFIWMTGATGINVTYVNKPYLDFLGLNRLEDFLDAAWERLIHPDDIQTVYEVYGRAMTEQKPYLLEARYKNAATGNYHWFHVQGSPRFETDGSYAGFVGTLTGITTSKDATDKLRESEARFRSLVEEAPVATCLFVGRDMVIEVANEAMIEVWGKGPGVIGKPLAEALPELKGQHFLPLLDELFTTGNSYSTKGGRANLLVNGKLETFYFDYDFKPLRSADGIIYAILDTAVDVTAQIVAKQALEQSEANLRSMILQAPVAICIFSGPEYTIEIVNPQMAQMLGREAQAIEGRPFFDAMPEVRNIGLEELLKGVMDSGFAFTSPEQPFSLPRSTGMETIWVKYIYEPLKNKEDRVERIMVLAIDVTQQVLARQKIEEVVATRTKELAKANNALHQSNNELQRSNASLEEFAHVASHDLKEPVRKIRNFTDRLKIELGKTISEKAAIFLSKIDSAATRMYAMIDGVLLYSSIGAGDQPQEQVNLNEIIKNIEIDLEVVIAKGETLIHYSNLPTITGSSVLLYQLFYNLVSNSLKFAKAGVPMRINITAEKVDDSRDIMGTNTAARGAFKISIADNGIGFDQSQASKVFQTFYRLNAKDKYEGTGLGLALCKKIVERHGGSITAEGKEGEGVVFTIVLPK